MTIRVEFESRDFPTAFGVRSGILKFSMDDLLWAALTVGRRNTFHFFRHGNASFHDAIFRLALIRMAVERHDFGKLRRTDAFSMLDPTEKGMVSYYIGMTFCKLFSEKILKTPWLMHLSCCRQIPIEAKLGRSRPDLIGQNQNGEWYVFESKGRSSKPSSTDIQKAKQQANRVISIGGQKASLNIATFTYFKKDHLEFFWCDPEAEPDNPITLAPPESEWQYYFAPAFSLSAGGGATGREPDLELADVRVEVHPTVRNLLTDQQWEKAQRWANSNRDDLIQAGYQPDGFKVIAGKSWLS